MSDPAKLYREIKEIEEIIKNMKLDHENQNDQITHITLNIEHEKDVLSSVNFLNYFREALI